jgi:hypothetical protein
MGDVARVCQPSTLRTFAILAFAITTDALGGLQDVFAEVAAVLVHRPLGAAAPRRLAVAAEAVAARGVLVRSGAALQPRWFPTPYAFAGAGGTVEDSPSAGLGRSGLAASESGASGFGGSGPIAIARISSRHCSTNVWRAGSLAPSSAFWKRSNALLSLATSSRGWDRPLPIRPVSMLYRLPPRLTVRRRTGLAPDASVALGSSAGGVSDAASCSCGPASGNVSTCSLRTSAT